MRTKGRERDYVHNHKSICVVPKTSHGDICMGDFSEIQLILSMGDVSVHRCLKSGVYRIVTLYILGQYVSV